MPGLTARSAKKNVSKAKNAALTKNAYRIEAAFEEDLEGYCIYGKVLRCNGHRMFTVLNSEMREHLCHIRGNISKACRISVDDVVLLSIRDYETRASSANGVNAVYDIIAQFDTDTVKDLARRKIIPAWMKNKASEANEKKPEGNYEFTNESDDDSEDSVATITVATIDKKDTKKDKKKHRSSSLAGGGGGGGRGDDSDIDIDAI
jgi:translation initiation factor IF-1